MFCPKCGSQLERIGRELTCRRGDMGLSPHLEEELTAAFASGIIEPAPTPFDCNVGDDWFCPADGTPMLEHPRGLVECPACGRSLNRFVHQLVELHPHSQL